MSRVLFKYALFQWKCGWVLWPIIVLFLFRMNFDSWCFLFDSVGVELFFWVLLCYGRKVWCLGVYYNFSCSFCFCIFACFFNFAEFGLTLDGVANAKNPTGVVLVFFIVFFLLRNFIFWCFFRFLKLRNLLDFGLDLAGMWMELLWPKSIFGFCLICWISQG